MEDFIKWIVAGFAGGAGIWLLIKSSLEKYVGGFLEEKGKNLATKQDIGNITQIVEGIKHENSVFLEEIKATNKLKMAALDKRLQVHQEAYSLWQRLVMNSHIQSQDEFKTFSAECEYWWFNNCLYLEGDVRKSFYDLLQTAEIFNRIRHKQIDKNEIIGKGDETYLKIAADILFKFGNKIEEAIQLPSIKITAKNLGLP
jgi:hypothetical protein